MHSYNRTRLARVLVYNHKHKRQEISSSWIYSQTEAFTDGTIQQNTSECRSTDITEAHQVLLTTDNDQHAPTNNSTLATQPSCTGQHQRQTIIQCLRLSVIIWW